MNQIYFDPTDQESMNRLMDEHGDSKTMYPGTNEYGEDPTSSAEARSW